MGEEATQCLANTTISNNSQSFHTWKNRPNGAEIYAGYLSDNLEVEGREKE
jgi:hypothetical protein